MTMLTQIDLREEVGAPNETKFIFQDPTEKVHQFQTQPDFCVSWRFSFFFVPPVLFSILRLVSMSFTWLFRRLITNETQ